MPPTIVFCPLLPTDGVAREPARHQRGGHAGRCTEIARDIEPAPAGQIIRADTSFQDVIAEPAK
jgi:hypothetical protein